jgi:hypothetical protein
MAPFPPLHAGLSNLLLLQLSGESDIVLPGDLQLLYDEVELVPELVDLGLEAVHITAHVLQQLLLLLHKLDLAPYNSIF